MHMDIIHVTVVLNSLIHYFLQYKRILIFALLFGGIVYFTKNNNNSLPVSYIERVPQSNSWRTFSIRARIIEILSLVWEFYLYHDAHSLILFDIYITKIKKIKGYQTSSPYQPKGLFLFITFPIIYFITRQQHAKVKSKSTLPQKCQVSLSP